LSASIRAPGLVAGDFGVEAARVTGAQPIVAAELMHGSPCPVAVVPSNFARGRPLREIGAAYVDSDEARDGRCRLGQAARRACRTRTSA
jgi:hypothetical protein